MAKDLELLGYERGGDVHMLTPSEQTSVNCMAMLLDCLEMQAQEKERLQSSIDLEVQPLETGVFQVTIKLQEVS